MSFYVVRCTFCGCSRVAVVEDKSVFVFLCHVCGEKRHIWKRWRLYRGVYGPFGLRAAIAAEKELNA